MKQARQQAALFHGGDLSSASEKFGQPKSGWIDLSTGINPMAYPSEGIPHSAFCDLPYLDADFVRAVESYYGKHSFIPLSGSQQLIHSLPSKLASLPVILPALGYQEHQRAWSENGQPCRYYDALNETAAIDNIDAYLAENSAQHLVIINPNNPTGQRFSTQQLNSWSEKLAESALIIVDEAFIDLSPSESMLSADLPKNVLVLRSFGKFFGLAGIRVGFAFAHSATLERIQAGAELWPINGPAIHLLKQAFGDRLWQRRSRKHIEKSSLLSQELFAPLFAHLAHAIALPPCGLFCSYHLSMPEAKRLYEFFARAGILLRLIPIPNNQALLRIGILNPSNSRDIAHINSALAGALNFIKQSNHD